VDARAAPRQVQLGEAELAFLQADEAAAGDDDVVQQFDAQQAPCFDELLRERGVLRTGRGVAGRMETAMLVVAKFIDGRTLPLLFKQPS
jgi:hypothetical protein